MVSAGNGTKQNVVGRFAPSPTGPLHLGSLVAALGSYLFARQPGGRWLLRIEDLDVPRVVPGIADDMKKTLELLGLHWDEEVLYQSLRTEVYQAALQELIHRGVAYSCGCTRAEIARISSAQEDGEELLYPGVCREGLPPGKVERAYRVKVYDEMISFDDGIMGRYSQLLSASCGDFVIQRADGPFAYHLAVVVDDAAGLAAQSPTYRIDDLAAAADVMAGREHLAPDLAASSGDAVSWMRPGGRALGPRAGAAQAPDGLFCGPEGTLHASLLDILKCQRQFALRAGGPRTSSTKGRASASRIHRPVKMKSSACCVGD